MPERASDEERFLPTFLQPISPANRSILVLRTVEGLELYWDPEATLIDALRVPRSVAVFASGSEARRLAFESELPLPDPSLYFGKLCLHW